MNLASSGRKRRAERSRIQSVCAIRAFMWWRTKLTAGLIRKFARDGAGDGKMGLGVASLGGDRS